MRTHKRIFVKMAFRQTKKLRYTNAFFQNFLHDSVDNMQFVS